MRLTDSVLLLAAGGPPGMLPAPEQMAVSLGWKLILACFGVAFPTMIFVMHRRGIVRDDPDALRLAKRWAKVSGVLFAIGAVSGTVLSFEMGLLWPGLMGRFGDVLGLGFAVEGLSFFVEAIFLGIYLYGWDRMPPRRHLAMLIPMAMSGIVGSFCVVSVNAWMNDPAGFALRDGVVTDINPWAAMFNNLVWLQFLHMWVGAFMLVGLVISGVYAAGLLGGRTRALRLGQRRGDRPAVHRALAGVADRQHPAGQARRFRTRHDHRVGPGAGATRWGADQRRGAVGGADSLGRLLHCPGILRRACPRPGHGSEIRLASGQSHPHVVSVDGGDRHAARTGCGGVLAGPLARARPAGKPLVFAVLHNRRAAGRAGVGIGMGHHRSGPSTVDGVAGVAHHRCSQHELRTVVELHRRADHLPGHDRRGIRRSAVDGQAMERRRRGFAQPVRSGGLNRGPHR